MTSLEVPCYRYVDLVENGLLGPDQVRSAKEVSLQFATPAQLLGGESTSLEAAGTVLSYRLLAGDAVREHLPWLDALYRGPLVDLASQAAGEPMICSTDIMSGININVLEGEGARYERHFDSNPLTGVIFLTDHNQSTGGQLVFEREGRSQVLDPREGWLALFDARKVPHWVSPLRTGTRISAPLNFYTAAEGVVRSKDLDRYLYSSESASAATREGAS